MAILFHRLPLSRRLAFFAGVAVVTCVFAGCRDSDDGGTIARQLANTESTRDEFTEAANYFKRLDEFHTQAARDKVVKLLNDWLEKKDVPKGWRQDPAIAELPTVYRTGYDPLTKLNVLHFDSTDLMYLEQCSWSRDVVQQLKQDNTDSLAMWLPSQDKPNQADIFGSSAASPLKKAVLLFDWTVRNIALEPAAAPDATTSGDGKTPPAWEGVAGAGYSQLPWQTMLYGKGDAIERGRVFLSLLRQADIPAAYVGIANQEGDAGEHQAITPWAVAVVVDNKALMFDPFLGLPIPGPDGVATLQQLIDDPALLRKLDVQTIGGEDLTYPVQADDLTNLVAVVDADPSALTAKISLIESRLTGDAKMNIAAAPSELGAKLQECQGIDRSQLWTLPIDAAAYHDSLERIRGSDANVHQMLIFEREIFNGTFLRRGRTHFFKRAFVGADDKTGARYFLMNTRVNESDIANLHTPEVQEKFGLTERLPQDANLRRLEVAMRAEQFRRSNVLACYFLGLVQYEDGEYRSAINWFERMLELVKPEDPLFHAANYVMSRCAEAQGDIEKARGILFEDEASPQAHGNLVRATLLRKKAP